MLSRTRTRRRLALLLGVTALLGAWLGFRALQIKDHLDAARAELSAVTAGQRGVEATLRSTNRATSEVDAARSAARDPLWRAAAAVPYLGRSFALVAGATEVSHRLVHETLPPLRVVLEEEQAAPIVRGGQVDLARLARVEPLVRAAAASAAEALLRAQRLPEAGLPGVLRTQRTALLEQVKQLAKGLESAQVALELAPGMLGRDGPRRYFLAVQNNAESRATGGLIGAYAILRADNGKITRERVGTDVEFKTAQSPVVDLGFDFNDHYDQYASRVYWSAAVLTPDFPSAGAIIAGLWTAQGGGKIDGVIGIDPIAMAELLKATGPVTAVGRQIGADNVVDFIMRDEYAEFDGRNEARKQVLRQIAGQLFDRVIGGASSTALVTALATAGGTGHLQIFSSVPAEQAALSDRRVGGALPAAPGAFLEVVTQNAAGNKVDYYIRRKVTYSRPSPGTGRVELTLSNLVDPAKVPAIVAQRLDVPPKRPGETKLILSFYASAGSRVREVLVDGVAVPVQAGKEKGHGYAELQVLVAPGHPVTVVATLDDPGGPLTYRQQPLVVDDELDLQVPTS